MPLTRDQREALEAARDLGDARRMREGRFGGSVRRMIEHLAELQLLDVNRAITPSGLSALDG